jgi:hypothetical protein
MHKLLHTLLGIVFIGLGSCDGILNVDVVGDGNRVVRSRNVSSFSKIYLDTEFVVELKSGDTQSVEVECDSNLLLYVTTEVVNNLLTISRKPNFDLFPRQPIYVNVVVPSLTSVEVMGGGKISADTLVNESLDLTLLGVSEFYGRYLDCTLLAIFNEGSTHLNINGNFRKLELKQKGSGEVLLSGTGENLELFLEGSGKIDAAALAMPLADVKLYGSGLIFCYASEVLNAFISGNGRIYYYGSPSTIEKEISGEGLILSGN